MISLLRRFGLESALTLASKFHLGSADEPRSHALHARVNARANRALALSYRRRDTAQGCFFLFGGRRRTLARRFSFGFGGGWGACAGEEFNIYCSSKSLIHVPLARWLRPISFDEFHSGSPGDLAITVV